MLLIHQGQTWSSAQDGQLNKTQGHISSKWKGNVFDKIHVSIAVSGQGHYAFEQIRTISWMEHSVNDCIKRGDACDVILITCTCTKKNKNKKKMIVFIMKWMYAVLFYYPYVFMFSDTIYLHTSLLSLSLSLCMCVHGWSKLSDVCVMCACTDAKVNGHNLWMFEVNESLFFSSIYCSSVSRILSIFNLSIFISFYSFIFPLDWWFWVDDLWMCVFGMLDVKSSSESVWMDMYGSIPSSLFPSSLLFSI